jgi:hypothetical protein
MVQLLQRIWSRGSDYKLLHPFIVRPAAKGSLVPPTSILIWIKHLFAAKVDSVSFKAPG